MAVDKDVDDRMARNPKWCPTMHELEKLFHIHAERLMKVDCKARQHSNK